MTKWHFNIEEAVAMAILLLFPIIGVFIGQLLWLWLDHDVVRLVTQ